jgi:hypothetical protein
MFPTKPGVKDPMAIPASVYLTMVGRPARLAITQLKNGRIKATAMLISNGDSRIAKAVGMNSSGQAVCQRIEQEFDRGSHQMLREIPLRVARNISTAAAVGQLNTS